MSRDISDRKKAEEVERRLVREHAARTAAEEAVRIRDDFVAVAGHELRTPLAALLMQIQSVQRSQRAALPPYAHERLDKAVRSVLRLSELINQLLDVSRITSGRLHLEPEVFDLAEMLREVVARFREGGGSSGAKSPISLRTDGNVEGLWDRVRIEQVLTNLLSNALKYGQGKPVELELAIEGGCAVVRVSDHGIGIDRAHHERIFLRFERAVAARHYGGFGLGLWITRQIVEASGGTIAVDSEPNRGSTFVVRLPLRSAQDARVHP
jgi:signal transduction histidine kinase